MDTRPRADYEDDLDKGVDYRILLGVSERPEFEEVVAATRAQLQGLLRDSEVIGSDLAGDQARRIERAFKALTEDRGRYLAYLDFHRTTSREAGYEGEPF